MSSARSLTALMAFCVAKATDGRSCFWVLITKSLLSQPDYSIQHLVLLFISTKDSVQATKVKQRTCHVRLIWSDLFEERNGSLVLLFSVSVPTLRSKDICESGYCFGN